MDPHLTATIAVATIPILITLGYLAVCWISPFKTCDRCAGTGRTTTRILRRPRACRRCERGLRLRTGRRILNYFRHLHTEANR